jgi:hypothetical protein
VGGRLCPGGLRVPPRLGSTPSHSLPALVGERFVMRLTEGDVQNIYRIVREEAWKTACQEDHFKKAADGAHKSLVELKKLLAKIK